MKNRAAQKIVIIGCGNVAWHLAKQLSALKKYSLFVYNHKANKALIDFKKTLKCSTGVGLQNVIHDADFYFICVSDKYIAETADALAINNPNAILMHTSGSVKLKELGKQRLHDTAVFYPLQTFSKGDEVNWKEIPIVIEATKTPALHKLTELAAQLSLTIIYAKEKERLSLHLAAVMANNFTNALYAAANELLTGLSGGSDIKLLLPLIRQTAAKLERMTPVQAQTGPAKRGDKVVMEKHLDLLRKKSDLKKIYKQVTKLIEKQQTTHA